MRLNKDFMLQVVICLAENFHRQLFHMWTHTLLSGRRIWIVTLSFYLYPSFKTRGYTAKKAGHANLCTKYIDA